MRKVVKVSTRYIGTSRSLGKWVKPKKMVVNISPSEISRHGKNRAIYLKLKRKNSLRRKEFSWW